jgi:flavin reductase (DIM6/NTAB) family NADH-FMN oxidoreductase RutF
VAVTGDNGPDRRARVSGQEFRDGMARWTSGVTVVTAAGDPAPAALTASAFSALSLDPPLVLVCVERSSRQHDRLLRAPGFAVHVLDAGQEHLSRHFAREAEDKLHGVDHEIGPFGAPLLPLGLARLVCAREATPDGGDHTILIGRVVAVEIREGEPLVHFGRAYRWLAPGGHATASPEATSAT